MKMNSMILDHLGKPFQQDKPKYQVPQTLTPDGFKSPVIATDSKAFDNGLPINMWAEQNGGIYDVDGIITTFAGWGVLSMVAQNGIVQNIIKTISNAATQEWGKLYYNGKDGKGKNAEKKMTQIEARFRKLQLRENVRIAHQKTILFGGAMMYPKLQGDDKYLDKELIMSKHTIKSIRYLKVIEPIYAVPTSFNASDPLSKYFYTPEIWSICGQPVHISRMAHFMANDAPILLKPVYQFFGISVIQLLLSYLQIFDMMRYDISKIVSRYNINVLKTDMNAILEGSTADQDVTSLKTRLQMFTKLATNFGVIALDNEMEEWQQFNMTLTGLDKLVQQNLEYIPAISQIPATKLFGQSPTGFGSTGEHELKGFYDLIKQEQTSVLLPHINYVLELVQYELFGEVDPNIEFKFNSLEQQSDLDKSVILTNYANATTTLTQSGQLTVEESRNFLANQEELGLTELDVDANITDLVDTGENDDDVVG